MKYIIIFLLICISIEQKEMNKKLDNVFIMEKVELERIGL